MKADLTRNTFDPLNHYSAVLMQQGRVQLDADWNEQHAILLHYLRRLGADLIGPHGGPAAAGGFGIAPLRLGTEQTGDFRIGAGRYYVDGILCELGSAALALQERAANGGQVTVQVTTFTLDGQAFRVNQFLEVFDAGVSATGAPFPPTLVRIAGIDPTHRLLTLQGPLSGLPVPGLPRVRRVTSYRSQGSYPVAAATRLPEGRHQVYLDVWERHVSHIEDDGIREVALGGPDTATRTQVVWQVKVTAPCDGAGHNPDSPCCTADELAARLDPASPARLKARARRAPVAQDPCIVRPDARYRGAENQLYRVEVHTGGILDAAAPPTFKWSRDNGSVAFPIVAGGGTSIVTLETLGRDDRFGLRPGDWVAVESDESVLRNAVAPLLQVEAIDRTALTVTLSGPAPALDGSAGHPLLRRWDHQQGDPGENGLELAADGAARIVEDDTLWLHLEDGVEIQFQGPGDAGPTEYRSGDYWLIPARTATGDVEWPTEPDGAGVPVPLALPPDGIVHHYAPLAVITVDAAGNVQDDVDDCRRLFAPLA